MLTLTRHSLSATASLNGAAQHTWPLKIVCTPDNGSTLSPKIFVFHAVKPDVAGPEDVFEAVASVHQMQDIPIDQPHYVAGDPTKCVPYYRLAELTWHCLSSAEADDLWEHIKADVTDLVGNQKALDNLKTESTFSI
jgi:hypothetical protein